MLSGKEVRPMEINEFKALVEGSKNIVFFGGAGVSTESNIPDFRSQSGIYRTIKEYNYPPEVMLSHTFLMTHPREFFDFYRKNMIYIDAKPNTAHIVLAELEQKGILKAVITQNIDGLHQQAGSKNVIELHGSVYRNYCMKCNEKYSLEYVLKSPDIIPKCSKCGGTVRPDVVLYEEFLDDNAINQAISYIRKADVLIVGGTSLAVYPAAGLINYYRGNKLVLINKSATPYDGRANLVIRDSIGKVFGSLKEQ